MQNNSKQSLSRIWLHGDTFESLKSSVFSLARKLNVESDSASPSEMFEFLTEMTLKHSSRMVVVIDNVDSKFDEVSKVIKMIRKHENIFIIVTSRNKLILENAGQTMLLDVLSKQDARNILRNFIENISDSDADLLCKLVQYYPLALQQAVAYIKNRGKTF